MISKGRELLSNVQELSTDPSFLQSTVDDLRREARNVLRRTPEGLETPSYEVIKETDIYQIRKYAPYSVCGTAMPPAEDAVVSALNNGNGIFL